MKFQKLLLLLLSTLIFSCSQPGSGESKDSDDSYNPAEAGILSKIDIVGATSLFVAPSKSRSNSRNMEGNTLFKITEDGTVKEVTYVDGNGNEITQIYAPESIYNIDGDFVIIDFGYSYTYDYDTGMMTEEAYLVRKSDGAIFSLSNVGTPTDYTYGNFVNSEDIQRDNNGNIYYITDNWDYTNKTVVKIDITDPSNLIKTDYSADMDYVNSFAVSPQGHLIYSYGQMDTYYRIKKSKGGLENIPGDYSLNYWIGLDGNIKYHNSSYGSEHSVITVNIDPDTNVLTKTTATGTLDYFSSYDSYLIKFTDRTLGVATGTWGTILEYENPENTPRTVNINEIDNTQKVGYSNSSYYLSGLDNNTKSVLLKVDPSTDAVTYVTTPGQYDIKILTVSEDDQVTFTALRMSDGVKVIGSIDAKGTAPYNVNIIDDTLNSDIVILERIN